MNENLYLFHFSSQFCTFFWPKKGLNNNQFSTNDSDSSTDNVFQHIEHVYQISIRLSVIFSFYDPHRDEKSQFEKIAF